MEVYEGRKGRGGGGRGRSRGGEREESGENKNEGEKDKDMVSHTSSHHRTTLNTTVPSIYRTSKSLMSIVAVTDPKSPAAEGRTPTGSLGTAKFVG